MKTSKRQLLAKLARSACGVLTVSAATALAAMAAESPAAYPSKPITVIVPFTAGGGGDIQARMVLTRLGKELGQAIIFENVGGAGGNIGVQRGARAVPDGYTLVYGTNGTHAINPALYKNAGFNPRKDFQPIGRIASVSAMLVVRPNYPANSVAELVKLIKSKPGEITFASAGNGTTSHLAGEMFKVATGGAISHIPYKGGAQAIVDVMGGRVDFMIQVVPQVGEQVRGGNLKALAVTTPKRVASFPSVPTMEEAGVQDFQVAAWDALFVPVGVPEVIVSKLSASLRKILADKELVDQLAAAGAEPSASSPEELARFLDSEIARWGVAVKRSGAEVN